MSTSKMRICCLALLALTGCGKLPGQPDLADRPERPDEVLGFRALFNDNCRGCHGNDGRMGPAPLLNDKLFLTIAPEDELKRIVTNGRKDSLMPAFFKDCEGGHLTDKQIDALVKGMKNTWGGQPDVSAPLPSYLPDDPTRPGAIVGKAEAGAEVFTMACAGCHGDNGEGTKHAGRINDPVFLNLVSDRFLRTVVITGRPDLGMPNFADPAPDYRPKTFRPLTNQDVADVVELLASWRKQGDKVTR